MENKREEQIDELVSMIDRFMAGQGGHMSVQVREDGSVQSDGVYEKTVTTTRSLDCQQGNMACRTPTLFWGMEDETDA